MSLLSAGEGLHILSEVQPLPPSQETSPLRATVCSLTAQGSCLSSGQSLLSMICPVPSVTAWLTFLASHCSPPPPTFLPNFLTPAPLMLLIPLSGFIKGCKCRKDRGIVGYTTDFSFSLDFMDEQNLASCSCALKKARPLSFLERTQTGSWRSYKSIVPNISHVSPPPATAGSRQRKEHAGAGRHVSSALEKRLPVVGVWVWLQSWPGAAKGGS